MSKDGIKEVTTSELLDIAEAGIQRRVEAKQELAAGGPAATKPAAPKATAHTPA